MNYNYLDRCPNCAGCQFNTWGATAAAGHLHFCQCRCRECGLVFSNPQCSKADLSEYYGATYYEEHWPEALSLDQAEIAAAVQQESAQVERIRRYVGSGRLLEIGSGTGRFLAAARDAGFDPYGVEYSVSGLNHSRQAYGLTNLFQGTLEDAQLDAGSMDAVYAWHVIEHVLDLDVFVREIRRVMRPGGILCVGTENYKNASFYLLKCGSLLRGLPPPFTTSPEHTFVFTLQSLSDILNRRGFRVLYSEAYQPGWSEKMRGMRFRSPLSLAYFAAQHLINSVCHTGPLIRLFAEAIN